MGLKAGLAIGGFALVAAWGTVRAADAPYRVMDGNKVDKNTLAGWKAWRAAACERCHGPNQEGMTGNSMIESLKTLGPEEFKKAVLVGRPDKGMPGFNSSKQVSDNIDNLYAYLKGRSDGAIKSGRLEEIPQ